MEPNSLSPFGKFFIFLGLVMILVGLLIILLGKIPFLGRLPGDILIKRDNFVFYFPLATSILLSLVLSAILWLFSYLSK
ncbi:MAG: DUF2905 domain-containing protein [Chlorobi bacterium]|nr:DUF2905 domain-containing protein [Chlorobiota bacterium]